MSLVENHMNSRGFDENLLDNLIDLYNLSSLIDPNRVRSGIDIFRNFEYGYPLKWLKDRMDKDSKVLDIGSSSTIWPSLLFKKFGCKIHATDIDMSHLDTQKHYLYNIGELEQLGERFVFEYQDATKMEYEDNIFDVVCSISALEHIPGDGDVKAITEIERVLKPGGVFVFTAPYNGTFMETETDHYHYSYEKRYDLESINNRFKGSSKLKRTKLLFINAIHERSDQIADMWYKNGMYEQLGDLSMIFSMRMFKVEEEADGSAKGFIALYTKEG